MNSKFVKQVTLLTAAIIVSSNLADAAENFNYQVPQQQQYQPAYQQPTYQQPTYSQSSYQQQYFPQNTQNINTGGQLQGHVVTVPPGVCFGGVVSTPISSEYLTMGQPVNVTLGSDFYYGGSLIAPAGSTVMGTVTQAQKAKHGSINGKLKIKFTEITTPYGSRIPISAVIKTNDGTGVLVGGTKADVAKAYAKDIGVGSATGALAGLVGAAISGGEKGKGTAIMTGVGAGAGLVKSIYDKGENVVIPANARIDLQIDQPITVNPATSKYDY